MIDSDRERLVGLLAARERGAEDGAGLHRAVSGDPEAAEIAGGDRMVDRLLRYACTTDLGEEEFTRGVVVRIDAERRGDAFVRRVTRAARRDRSRRAERPGWLPLGLAAAGVVLSLLAGLWEPAPSPVRRIDATSGSKVEVVTAARNDGPSAAPVQAAVPKAAPAPRETVRKSETVPFRLEPPPPERDLPPEVNVAGATPKATVATIGTVERVEGPVTIGAGAPLLAGQTVETGRKGLVVLRMVDGTRIELSEGTSLETPDGTRRFLLTRGSLSADVVKQPKGSPLVFGTPNAEATVLGTSLRLTVGAGDKGATRLEVLEGKVRLCRTLDGKSVDVPTGHFAVAVAGTDLKARALPDPRVTEGLRALYTFEEGKGRVVRDVSGVGSPLNLVSKDEHDLSWIPGGGIALRSPTLIASPGPASKIVGACRASRAVTVEAWIRPASVEKGTLRYVVALGGARKEQLAFGLGLHADIGSGPTTYRAYLTTPKTMPPSDQMPDLETAPIVPGLAHVVFTRTASGQAALTVDGVERGRGIIEGDFSTWGDPLRLMLGDYSFEGIRPWLGEFHLLAFYSRALRSEEVSQNFEAGRRKFSMRK